VCTDILQVLAHKGLLTPTKVGSEVKIDGSLLGNCLDLLAKQSLIEERIDSDSGVVYAITEPGKRVLKFFRLDHAR
jgi:predicted transcriptional regulator